MSHHFDTQIARDDSRLNVLDMYLFQGVRPDATVMILTTNPDAGVFAPLTLHPEGVYAFRFDTNIDGREDMVFKFVFDSPRHTADGDNDELQHFRALHATGSQIPGDGGDLVAEGTVGEQATGSGEVKAYVGLAAELWAADAFGFFTVVNALFREGRYATEAFEHKNNLFAGRNNMAMVLEVPNTMLGVPRIGAWATASLFGHAPEAQVYRWGLPLFTHLFLSDPGDPSLANRYHHTAPPQDGDLFGPAVTKFAALFAGVAGNTADPEAHGARLAQRLVPAVLPYEIGTAAEFTTTRFNGRPLEADAFDVMLSLGANTAISDGVGPDIARIRREFPYCGVPYDNKEQAGMRPLRELIGLTY